MEPALQYHFWFLPAQIGFKRPKTQKSFKIMIESIIKIKKSLSFQLNWTPSNTSKLNLQKVAFTTHKKMGVVYE